MRPRLIIRLENDTDALVRWMAVDAQGAAEGDVRRSDLADAAAAAAGRQVVALVPGADCLLLGARIPTQSRQRLARAVPYALEDQLTEDVENLHFAVGERDAAGRLWVAVVARERMNAWLDALSDAGLDPEQIYPETLALPKSGHAWTVLAEPDRFLVRTGAEAGFAGDPGNLSPLLEAALTEAGDEAPERLLVYEAEGHRAELPDVAPEVERHTVDDATALLAENLSPRRAINLRTGPFARTRALQAQWRRWRVAAVMLAALVVVGTGRAWFENWSLQAESDQLREQINEAYLSAFPGRAPTYPRRQMEQRLAALRSGGDADAAGFLPLINRIAPVIKEGEGVDLSALSYRGDSLQLEFYTANLQQVDRLKQALSRLEGIQVEVRSAQSDGDRVQGRLQITVGS
jgi:general secretion pathway protein L